MDEAHGHELMKGVDTASAAIHTSMMTPVKLELVGRDFVRFAAGLPLMGQKCLTYTGQS